MTLKLTAASFLAGVKQSGLIDADRVDSILADLVQAGVNDNDSCAIASAMVDRKILTEWQSEKLLQGRHKGFILGRYRLLSLLGAGEMSAVYLAEHIMMERRCAIKVLPANKVQDTSYLGRFHREARAVAAMNHMNIVRAYDVDKQTESGTDIHFLVMEYVEGRNVEQVVKDQGPLDYVTAVDTIRQAADGLGHAHHLGMVHRDVKPGNLLIDNTGVVKLLDLGLARFFKSDDEESLTIKHDEKVLGTADYLAPEQAVDSHQVDARADIYSLGCTMYFALTGHPPFTDGTLVQRLLAHQTKTPPSVSYERPDIDPSLLAILDKMMAKKTSDRYQSSAEVSEALSRWLIEHAPTAWKQKHLMLVASLCGMDSFSAQALGTKRSDSEVSVLAPESMEKDRIASGDSPASGSSPRGPRSKSSVKLKQRDPRPGSSLQLPNAGVRPRATVPAVQELASKLSAAATVAATTQPGSNKIPLAPRPPLDEMTKTVLIGVAMLAAIVVCSFGMFYFFQNPGQGNNAKNEAKSSPTTQVTPVEQRTSV